MSLRQALEDDSIPYQPIILALSVGVWAFTTYISLRQLPHLKLTSPPAILREYLETEDTTTTTTKDPQANGEKKDPKDTFRKSTAYALDKLKFNILSGVINIVETWVLLSSILAPLFGVSKKENWSGISGLWELSSRLTEVWNERAPGFAAFGTGEIATSLMFVSVFSVVGMITSVPADLYRIFVMEEKHGFNKQTAGLWISDQIKSTALSVVFGLPLTAGLIWVVRWAGESFVQWTMVVIMGLTLVLYVVYPYLIAPIFNKFRLMSEFEEHKEVVERTKVLAKKIGFPLGRLWVMDGGKRSGHSNAFFFGLPGLTKHIVLYDTLLAHATPAQIEAVLAHELGHYKLNHTLLLMATSQAQIGFMLSTFRLFLWNPSLFHSFGFTALPSAISLLSPTTTQKYPVIIGLILAQQLFTPLSQVVTFTINGLTRTLEYQADRFAKDLGYAGSLKWALVRISAENKATTSSDWLYSAFHHSHPTLPERLARLDEKKSQ